MSVLLNTKHFSVNLCLWVLVISCRSSRKKKTSVSFQLFSSFFFFFLRWRHSLVHTPYLKFVFIVIKNCVILIEKSCPTFTFVFIIKYSLQTFNSSKNDCKQKAICKRVDRILCWCLLKTFSSSFFGRLKCSHVRIYIYIWYMYIYFEKVIVDFYVSSTVLTYLLTYKQTNTHREKENERNNVKCE